MEAVLYQDAPGVPVVELFSDLPPFNPQSAAYLIAAYSAEFPPGTVFLGVVDPGVGGQRMPLMLRADQRWYVGPDNGVFALVARRAGMVEEWEIIWRPEHLSASFHGRDLFAPVAARLANGMEVANRKIDTPQQSYQAWTDDLPQVIYIDHFGNAITGIRSSTIKADVTLEAGGQALMGAHTFSDVPQGAGFWYQNANGLVEIAVNQGNAAEVFGLTVGTPIKILI
jgi:S-adenosylmethionine hydrolase